MMTIKFHLLVEPEGAVAVGSSDVSGVGLAISISRAFLDRSLNLA
jgi:hypothetical protein